MLDLEPLPMESALEFWADKIQLSPGEYAALADEVKNRAFAVSGIAKGDELSTVYNALERGLKEGTTFADFKKDASAIFERRGWTGKGAWRVETIFRTNIQTAYNVGRYKEMVSVVKDRPYWQYSAVNDSRTRPTHLAMNGKIFRADHPFWDTWYPPNGFNCRCGVITLSQEDIDAEKLPVEKDDPTGGLLMPDQGFSHNPGKAVWGGQENETALAKYIDMPGHRDASDYRLRKLANIRAEDIPDMKGEILPGKRDDAFYKAEFEKRYGSEKIFKDAAGEPVVLSLRNYLVNKTPDAPEVWKFSKDGHGESIPLLQEMIESPFEIWLTPQQDSLSGKIRLTKRYISLWKTDDKQRIGGLMVFEVHRGQFQGVTAFVPLKKGSPDIAYIDKQRYGLLLYKLKGLGQLRRA